MKISLIGNGYWGSKIKPYLECENFFELIHVADSKSEIDRVINESEAVIIATPNNTHYEIAYKALDAGRHVMVEKPMAMTERECYQLCKKANYEDVALVCNYTYTVSPSVLKLIELTQGKKIIGMELSVRHLGRFSREFDVYWLLGSHMLSILDMFMEVKENVLLLKMDIVPRETGVIFVSGEFPSKIMVSLNYPYKETKVIVYLENETFIYNPSNDITLFHEYYEKPEWVVSEKIPQKSESYIFDERNNIGNMIAYFRGVILGEKRSNQDRAYRVTRLLEKL